MDIVSVVSMRSRRRWSSGGLYSSKCGRTLWYYADAPDRPVELLDSNRKHRERVTVIAQSGNNTDLAACVFKGTED